VIAKQFFINLPAPGKKVGKAIMQNQLTFPQQKLNSETVGEVKIIYKKTTHSIAAIESSLSTSNFIRRIWDEDTIEYIESFCVIALDRALNIVAYEFISTGGTSATIADPRRIFQFALLSNASAIILAHNHPSGNLNPSTADRSLTEKIFKASKLLDINLLDHIIVTKQGYFSFADEGLL
jgi:DNA repair protein RadC